MTGILITRTFAQGAATARRLSALGFACWQAPLLEVVPVPFVPPAGPVQALLVTSANAVPALSVFSPQLPVYAVGDRSARAVREAGFIHVTSAHGTAHDLALLVKQTLTPGLGSLVHLAGDVVSGRLAAILGAAGFWVESRIVYQARALDQLPADVVAACAGGRIDTVLLYSPRTAAVFSRVVENADWRRQLDLVCLSEAVRRAGGPGWQSVSVAARPDEDGLTEILTSLKKAV